jgi:hypothetical protein
MTCGAKTAAGKPCRRHVGQGAERCHVHSGGVVGRHDGLTPEVAARVVQALRLGAHRGVAAETAGISRTTLWRWLERGETESEGRFRDLFESVRRAEADAELLLLGLVHRAAQTHAWAATWILSHRYPENWGRHATAAKAHAPEQAAHPGPRAEPDLDVSDPVAREHFDELLRRRPADRTR